MKNSNHDSDTLLFTSAVSLELGSTLLELYGAQAGRSYYHANSGLYSCTVTGEDVSEGCVTPKTVADGFDTESFYADYLDLTSLQFYLSSKKRNKRWSKPPTVVNEEDNDDGNDYLYASLKYEHTEFPGKHFSWEIIRANPMDQIDGRPTGNATTDDGNHLLFQTYFRTMMETDWNNCNFDCCPFNDEPDSNGRDAHRDYHDWAYLHAYVRVRPSSYAVDYKTGDVFIAWQGFYKNCNPTARFETTKLLQWTIGISRLKTHAEDPTCVLVRKENGEPLGFSDLESNFSRCTVPVSIVYVSPEGRTVGLPLGGFTVIPAATEPPSPGVKPRRSFLLSGFTAEKNHQMNHLWAIAEGGDVTKLDFLRQDLLDIQMDISYMDAFVDNGNNMKLHYNQKTGRPDHICRTVLDKGITCMPIEVTEDNLSTYVKVIGEVKYLMNETQVHSFCAPTDESINPAKKIYNFDKKSRIVTGLDVLWNEKDGTPRRIFFGCYGFHRDGRLGSVDGDGENLIEMFPGAYSGDVALLPRELQTENVRESLRPDTSIAASSNQMMILFKHNVATIIGFFVVACITSYGFHRKYASSSISFRSLYSTTASDKNNKRRLQQKYLELPVITSTESSSPSSSKEFA